jgi:hypothetical protein
MIKILGFYITRDFLEPVCTTTCKTVKCKKAKVAQTRRIQRLFNEHNNLKRWEPTLKKGGGNV